MFKPFFVHINPFPCGKLTHEVKYRGATIRVAPNDETTVYVQTTFCSRKDNYCKKEGRSFAAQAKEVVVNKRALPKYVTRQELSLYSAPYAENTDMVKMYERKHLHLLKNFV